MSEALEFEVFTIFPAAIAAFVEAGLLGKAIERGLISVRCTDYREFTRDRHRTVDDAPFGGGAGMVIKPEPVAAALEAVIAERGPMHTILLTPSGRRFDQRVAERLASEGRIALLCGRYEGIDDRIREHFVDECLSIGDFVLNGGEVAAAAIIEAVGRLREGVLGNPESIARESFARESFARESFAAAEADPHAWRLGLVLEHPHYTRPANFRGREVPPVLLAGDHQAVEAWRRRAACLRTWALRPELRPRWRLSAGHPIVLAVAADTAIDADTFATLELLAERYGASLVRVGGPPMRDLKQLRKHVRKRHGREPWVIGVGAGASGEPEVGPRVVLDVLAYAAGHAPPPLILWFAGEHAMNEATSIAAWMTLVPSGGEGEAAPIDPANDPRLAIAPALIDISQPRAAGPLAPLVRTVLESMRAEGLLPAVPVEPLHQETSP